ncbi:hypothetical protein [Carboxylicivirga marina]|uniref:Cation-transporting P-type ATPase C-terminal domain-containing protein n=1 Tax=Carboxylicivirga marina TaxID=2800988 RepID=A0ABS1HQB9_9BACT|nr:hypothetical protein [Carboxylicivirga marina]MBK3519815.1 hypothetical protein [Carboxylicivirga marina]
MDELKDTRLKSLLQESRLEMPFSDFENKMMTRVKTELHGKRVISKNLKLSWLFFLFGSIFGLVLSVSLPMIQVNLGGFELQVLKYPVLALTLFIILWQLEAMIKLTVRHRKDN